MERALLERSSLALLSIALFVLLAVPSITFALYDISLAGVFEESVGYRYFYSLRHVYSNERPFIPQGHLVGLTHMALQVVLTALGYPPQTLYPRIDLFIRAASFIPLVLSAVAFAWVASALKGNSTRLLLAAFICFVTYNNRLPYAWQAIPDYMAWVIPVALITLGALLRLLKENHTQFSLRPSWWLGVFAGCTVAIKPTYVVFPLAIGVVMVFRAAKRRESLWILVSSISVAFLVFFLVLLAYYMRIRPARAYFSSLLQFAQSQQATLPNANYDFGSWLHLMGWQSRTDFAPWVVLAGLVVFASVLSPRFRVVLLLGPAAALSLYIAYLRFYTITLIETFFFALAAWTVIAVVAFRVGALNWLNRVRLTPGVITVFAAIALFLPVGAVILPRDPGILGAYLAYSNADMKLHAAMRQQGGVTVILVPTNSYHPDSVESAICKGNINLPGNTVWGASPFMKAAFPDRHCELAPRAIGDLAAGNLLFVRTLYETSEDAFRRVENAFNVNLADRHCVEIASAASFFIFCNRTGV